MAKLPKTALQNLAIVVISALLGVWVTWQAPGLARYTHDWMMRLRGPLPAPDDLAIVAIDEASIRRFGRFPWPRALTAQLLDKLSATQPKVIAMDVLYADPTTDADDRALSAAIARSGNVVLGAQLIQEGGGARWVKPLAAFESGAAGVGHVNVSTESEGEARQVLIRQSDDAGVALRAIAIEAIRVGDSIAAQAIRDTPDAFLLGPRTIPVQTTTPTLLWQQGPGSKNAPQVLPAQAMTIDYIGPTGSFASRTYSFSDVVDGKIPAQAFRGKYVLLGATAASLGDRLASPFVHQSDREGNQHGTLMPGVEVLANTVNTILRSRYYSSASDLSAFLMSALVAALTLIFLFLAQGRWEAVKQIGVFVVLIGAIVLVGYLEFRSWLMDPPLLPETVACASAGLLALIRRSLDTSARLDRTIADLSHAGVELAPLGVDDSSLRTIARLSEAAGVTIVATDSAGRNRVLAQVGDQFAPRLSANRVIADTRDGAYRLVTVPLRDDGNAIGILALLHPTAKSPSLESLEICTAIACSTVATAPLAEQPAARPGVPKGLEWKARALSQLNSKMLEEAGFLNAALRSIDDGLLIATADGRITFANPRAEEILAPLSPALLDRNLFQILDLPELDNMRRLLADRIPLDREIVIPDRKSRTYVLRVAAVSSGALAKATVLGLVATLSDVTRHHELRQTQTDVMALVSHEMRTPLTAIQGMSELLAQFDLDPARRRDMNTVINDEVKRLGRMINDYLDIARLESGVTVLRKTALRIPALLERTLLLLEPVAALKEIRLKRELDPATPVALADSDLVARAVTNLVSNAIKYSPKQTEVTVSCGPAGQGGVRITVADQGYGIPAEDLDRIFEKFYRIARVEDAGVPGTGLGLALVRDVAELHGGSVNVRSGVNGSVFTLILPGSEDEIVK